MQAAIVSWFPSPGFANFYGFVVVGVLLLDEALPWAMGGRGSLLRPGQDRYSFIAIYFCSLVGFAVSLLLRYANVGLVPAWIQVVALVLVIAGAFLREWAVALLGSSFSRTVTIKPDQRLITAGPYQRLRHPAYTGMILMDSAIVLGLGTWVGALVMLAIMLVPTLYRIRVEEAALAGAFGQQYDAWAQRTWRLFPGW